MKEQPTTVCCGDRISFSSLCPPLFFFREKSKEEREREREREREGERERERERAFVRCGRLSHDEFYDYSHYSYCEYEWFEDAKFYHARWEKNRAKTRDMRQRERDY